jgi:agmatinase
MNYGGLEEEFSLYENSSIAVLPVPYDGTSTWIKGADKGPDAILEASENMELYDIETNSTVYTKGIFTADAVLGVETPEKLSDIVEEKVFKFLSDKKFPVILGGEHSVSIGSIKAFAKFYNDITILQFDAHSDLRSEYEHSAYNHACVMARAQEVAPILQVGIRSMDVSEKVNMDLDRIFFAHQIRNNTDWHEKVLSKLTKNVYITIDLDVFDPSIMPSTGTPEPGGMFYNEVLDFIKKVNKRANIVGFDVVELCPNELEKSSNFMASKLIYQILSEKFIN